MQRDELALDDSWRALGRNRQSSAAALSADDAATLDKEWQELGRQRRSAAAKPQRDPDAGLTDEQKFEKRMAAQKAKEAQEKAARETSARLDRELGEILRESILKGRY